ncbi:MAG: single-stranded DNA-binding protein [Micrococcales bacterium]|nr:MAG: single-stranded DNA-binding protein [Micrococcales bacterium]PIE27039.1 MAG: single-stranded DNA-binding protein [Micrococcales bacterium]
MQEQVCAESSTAQEADDPAAAVANEPDEHDGSGAENTGEAAERGAVAGKPERNRRAPTKAQLEEEGDIAADYLEELLDIADLDGDIDIDVENERAAVSVIGDGVAQRGLRKLVGDGAVLEALQELTRLAVQTKTGDRSRLMLDIAGFRAERRTELEKVARKAVERVQEDGEAVHLDPMTPFERKVVHDVVAQAGLVSESEGETQDRHVVIRRDAE